ncbi:alcohol dehydrogenase GroES-like domain-containing protein [Annulohypoxylon maeteangense]|uniref:alcohol dehydrogenase GroES-like domain-containing protein n=1 Tax=Annulohypoxylon maeteangense TaxID=1927788 RepID=UPI00200792BE|nr:alcohol dehydrogenase GroES-like domain-containing protein [Annulohypoxylon maeteangense]KAI0884828.1 alcohol dehydrogenase GroES-like domain-containing protein [Annulohypoxylon maeteangense]
MALPKSYRQASFKAIGENLVLEDVPLNMPGAGEILVKVEACGVCHTDVCAQFNYLGGGFPIVPGHEIVGKVAAIGEEVTGWNVGDRIGAGYHGGQDGTCDQCLQNWPQMCDNPIANGINRNGGFAEYCTIRAEAAVRVPADIDAVKVAPLLCAGSTVFNALRHADLKPGDAVAIQGLGGLGHLAIQYANRMGYRVIAISRGIEKEAAARELGAHEYIDSEAGDAGAALKALGGAQVAFTTALSVEAFAPVIRGLKILGKLVVLSLPGEMTLSHTDMVQRGVSVQAWPVGTNRDSEDAVRFAASHGVECMVETWGLGQVQEAYDAMMSGKPRFRAVIKME